MSRSTISTEFSEQLDDSPINLLTAPPRAKELNGEATAKSKNQSVSAQKKKSKEPSEVDAAYSDHEKERMTVQMSRNIIERVKDAVYWTPGLTVAQLTEEALEHALDMLEKKNGKPFDKRRSELRPGRPLK
jgi:hypothetical protein